jgi:hypothetical protein
MLHLLFKFLDTWSLNMEVKPSAETSVAIYQATCYNITEYLILHFILNLKFQSCLGFQYRSFMIAGTTFILLFTLPTLYGKFHASKMASLYRIYYLTRDTLLEPAFKYLTACYGRWLKRRHTTMKYAGHLVKFLLNRLQFLSRYFWYSAR